VSTEQAWKVPVADIIARNYNLDIKNPHVGEQISHDPDELLANYRKLMAETADIRERLKNELMAALGGKS
jgi:type I restriction enzyme M protein